MNSFKYRIKYGESLKQNLNALIGSKGRSVHG